MEAEWRPALGQRLAKQEEPEPNLTDVIRGSKLIQKQEARLIRLLCSQLNRIQIHFYKKELQMYLYLHV